MTENCDCGHSKHEHILIQKDSSMLEFLYSPTRVMTMKEGRGQCKKCHCPEYEPPKKLVPRWGMDYSPRIAKNDDPEERCTRCGILLSNHENIKHPFQYANRTPT